MSLPPSRRLSLLIAASSIAMVSLTLTAPANAQTLVSAPFGNLGTQTLVPNGDFENALSGWGVFGGSVSFTASTVNPLFGTTSARGTVNSAFSGAGSALFVPVTGLTPGASYVLSAFINTSNLSPGVKAYVDLNDIAGDPDVGPVGVAPTTVFAYASFIAAGPSVNVRFVVDAPNGATAVPGTFATADNIAVTPAASFVPASPVASAAPEPASLALLTLTALSLVGSRRRHRSRAAPE